MPKAKKLLVNTNSNDWFTDNFGQAIAKQGATFARYDKRYGKKSAQGTWQTLGNFKGLRWAEATNQARFEFQRGTLLLEVLTPAILRLRLIPKGADERLPFSYSTLDELVHEPMLLQASERHIWHSQHAQALAGYEDIPQAFSAFGALSLDVAWQKTGDFQVSLLEASQIKAVYGTGQRTFDLNLLGRDLRFWNTDAGAYVRGFEPINTTIPLAIFQRHSLSYGIFADASTRSQLSLKPDARDAFQWTFEGGQAVLYLIRGASPLQVTEQFTALTGRMPMPPLWALGYHQARYSYMSQAEVLEVARELRQRGIPCDALYLDIDYMDGYRVFTFNSETFPDPQALTQALHAMGYRLVTILDPGVKIDPEYGAYQRGKARDAFIKMPDGEPVVGVVWPAETHHPDFTKPDARAWWADEVKDFLVKSGVDGVWNDMNEPLYFGKGEAISPPDYVQHDKEGMGGTHLELHNVYGMQMARATRAGIERAYPERRAFNITRAGWAGTQRYASSWTGDNQSTWDDLRLSIAMNLQMALSGQSFTGPDVGGFAKDTTPELLARWTQAACLFPFFRNHSAIDTIRQEPYLFGTEIERICREAIQLRYQLMPALYTAFAQCHRDGTPILRPVLLDDGQALDDQFLLGDSLLVAPVLTPHTLRRPVYLPSMIQHRYVEWYDFWTGERMDSFNSLHMVEAPADRLPLFVRAGSVLPLWEGNLQNLSQAPTQGILRVYAGNGISHLYEDAGEGLDYLQGAQAWHSFESFLSDERQEVALLHTHTGSFKSLTQYRYEVVGAEHLRLLKE